MFKDLCARLPYNVKGLTLGSKTCTLIMIMSDGVFKADTFVGHITSGQFKPYLRPMSSMTEEEKKELQKITNNVFYSYNNYISNSEPSIDGEWHTSNNKFVTNIVCDKLISWLDENHFDHRTDEEGKTLIEKGIALDAKDMYNNKTENNEQDR